MTENDLYKNRGYRGCISSAYNLYCANFMSILKNTWIPALIGALAASSLSFFTVPSMSSPSFLHEALSFLGLCAVAGVVCFLSNCAMTGKVLSMLVEAGFKKCVAKTVKAGLACTLIALVSGILLWGAVVGTSVFMQSHKYSYDTTTIAAMAVAGLLVTIFFAVLLPMAYSIMKYLADGNSKIKDIFGRNYLDGWKRWGFLFVLSVISGIIICVATFIIMAPSWTLAIAKQANDSGMALGDPSGLPGYFGFLSFVVGTGTGFCMYYAGVWMFLVLYYSYGSILTKIKENKRQSIQQG